MTTLTFAEKFQEQTAISGVQQFAIEDLLEYRDNASTSQVPVIQTRVDGLVKSITKGQQLFMRPVVAYVTDVDGNETFSLVSGRHTVSAIADICENWGYTAAGKLVKAVSPEHKANLVAIEGMVECIVVECADLETLHSYMIHANGSRSMTGAETALCLSAGGNLNTKTKTAHQLQLGTELHVAIPDLTFNTAYSIIGNLIGVTRKVGGCTGIPDLIKMDNVIVVSLFTRWWSSARGNYSNTARLFATISADFMTWLKTTPSTMNSSVSEWDMLQQSVPADEPKSKKTSRTSELAEALAAAKAELDALRAQLNG